jgi:hypothetical protein
VAILDLVSWVRFFGGSLWVTGERFLSITSTAAYPTWPLRQPFWIWFLSIIWRMPASTGQIFLWLIGGHQYLHHIPLLPKPYLPYATPCIALVHSWLQMLETECYKELNVFGLNGEPSHDLIDLEDMPPPPPRRGFFAKLFKRRRVNI